MKNTVTAASAARQIAVDLLAIEAVSLSPDAPFTWSSGLKAPLYCDNRLTMAHPEIRARIAAGFARQVEEQELRPQVIAGTATAGIPHAAWLADRMGLPMVYVRSEPKEHGQGRQVEGHLEEGQRVVLVEDLVSTGGSSMNAVGALQEAGAEVEAVLAIFSYGLARAKRRFADAPLPLYTLTDFDTLLEVAAEEGHLAPEAVNVLQRWRQDPKAWSQARGESEGVEGRANDADR